MLQVKDFQSFICSNFLEPHHKAPMVKVPKRTLNMKTTFTTFSSKFSWVLVSSTLNWRYYPPCSAVRVAVRIVKHNGYGITHTVTWRALYGGKRLLLYSGNKILSFPRKVGNPSWFTHFSSSVYQECITTQDDMHAACPANIFKSAEQI